MEYQAVFKRYEIKYMLTEAQKDRVLAAMAPHMEPDSYGRTTVRNLYFDTDTYRLARRSIEKPAYKEKLRIRSYCLATPDSPVFVELKKKYQSVVYKRRLSLAESAAMAWVGGGQPPEDPSQIAREIEYFLSYYGALHPAAFLSYEREAYRCPADNSLRVTFDDTILFRQEELSLTSDAWGSPLLPPGHVLMEVKCAGSIPLWMIRTLSRERLYKTSFSKYGTAYQSIIYPTLKEAATHV